ncbi:MAG: WYL domain-containing protein, partial [Hyphomicrobiaceae bacterium]
QKQVDGSIEITFHVAGLDEIKQWILSFGSEACAVEPPELVAAGRDTISQIVIVLSTPALREYAAFLIPLVLAASLVAAPLIGWKLAPAVRAEAIHRAHMQCSDGY